MNILDVVKVLKRVKLKVNKKFCRLYLKIYGLLADKLEEEAKKEVALIHRKTPEEIKADDLWDKLMKGEI